MIELAILAVVVAASIVLRIAMSRPPRKGLAGSVRGRPDSSALPMLPITTSVEALAGPPPHLAVQPRLARMPELPAPDASLAVLGIDADREDDDKKLWLLARDRLARRVREPS